MPSITRNSLRVSPSAIAVHDKRQMLKLCWFSQYNPGMRFHNLSFPTRPVDPARLSRRLQGNAMEGKAFRHRHLDVSMLPDTVSASGNTAPRLTSQTTRPAADRIDQSLRRTGGATARLAGRSARAEISPALQVIDCANSPPAKLSIDRAGPLAAVPLRSSG